MMNAPLSVAAPPRHRKAVPRQTPGTAHPVPRHVRSTALCLCSVVERERRRHGLTRCDEPVQVFPHPELSPGRSGVWLLPATAQKAATVRRLCRRQLAAWQAEALVDDVQLIVTELFSNALRHAAPPYTLALLLHRRPRGRDAITVALADCCPDQPHLRAPYEDGGRGLALVDGAAAAWGCHQLPQYAEKFVWAVVSVGGEARPAGKQQ